MADLIDRQAAIDAVRSIMAITGTSDDKILLIDKAEVQTELMMLPSAQPKTGYWMWSVDEYGESWLCSECLSEYVAEEGIPTWAHYCPNCGARMEGVDDDGTD